MTAHQFSFPQQARIRKRREILFLQENGKKLYSRHFVIIIRPSPLPASRLAITISRRVEKRATKRNYVKRCVREIFRLHRFRLQGNFDILVIARKNAQLLKHAEMKREILGALHHHGFLK